ncbi:hypothetical protein [Lamprocystis purpurea]|jgi:hypothetical protein|uniref:hypothetical protein n=1 Tax=Lamprocystis purpurea TaxID=61598 RepID=UPI0003675CD0|nr:hypothetical protein [Lamprocystis purpurea]
MSPDFNLGDLAILQRSAFHPEYNGALAEIVAPEQWRGSLTPSRCPRPVQRLYRVRLITPKDGELVFSAARYQLRPLDGVEFERAWPLAATESRCRRALVPPSDRDIDDQCPRAGAVAEVSS